MNSGLAILGLILGAGANIGLYVGVKLSWWLLGAVAVESIVVYIVARFTAGTGFGEVMRGWLIGMNSAINGILAFAFFNLFAPLVATVPISIVIGLLNLLTAIHIFSQSEVYQGFVGWLVWAMPMAWLVTGLGLLFYAVSFLCALFTAFQVDYLKFIGMRIDWRTGTLFMKGGLISNLNPIDTAFNMGNFSFVDKNDTSTTWHMNHEAGHTLNLAAFGSLFHLIGAVDENVFQAGSNAYAERLAESNNSTGGNVIPMWA